MAIVPGAVIAIAAAFKQRKYYFYIKKKQVLLKPLTPIRRKLPLDYKKAITILGKVLSK